MHSALRKPCTVCVLLLAAMPTTAAEKENSTEATVEIRRQDREDAAWWVAETASFRVYHQRSPELAKKAALRAELTRSEIYHKWFDEDAADWGPRCDIFLHDDSMYFQDAGLPAGLPGCSTMQVDSGRIIVRRIDLNGTGSEILAAVLPHEVTHIVMWSWFGQQGFPQWVNEGTAVLTEPRDRIERHLRNLPRHRRQGELFPIGQLMRSRDYPERRRIGAFYAQSVSVVEFLAGEKGPATFARFVRDGMRQGYEAAAQEHYGWSLDELERQWWQHAFGAEFQASAP